MSLAFVYTGQGEQAIGMGKDILEAFPDKSYLFEEIRNITDVDIKEICFNGPIEKLTDPHISGLAIFAISTLINEILSDNSIKPKAVAGYSIGQYSALHAANSISRAQCIQLIDFRGKNLKDEATKVRTSMLGVIGVSEEAIIYLLHNYEGRAFIANYNSPGNFSISYLKIIEDDLILQLEKLNPIKVVIIPVHGGWHSEFMKPAAEKFKVYLNSFEITSPKYLFIDNYTADVLADNNEIKRNLYFHVFKPVKWYQSIRKMIEMGITDFVEIGYSNQLSKFIKFTNRKVNVYSTGTFEQLNNTIKIISNR